MKRLILITILLPLLAGCSEDAPGWLMHHAIDLCAPNGGVASFHTWSSTGAISFRCENGAEFYVNPEYDSAETQQKE